MTVNNKKNTEPHKAVLRQPLMFTDGSTTHTCCQIQLFEVYIQSPRNTQQKPLHKTRLFKNNVLPAAVISSIVYCCCPGTPKIHIHNDISAFLL